MKMLTKMLVNKLQSTSKGIKGGRRRVTPLPHRCQSSFQRIDFNAAIVYVSGLVTKIVCNFAPTSVETITRHDMRRIDIDIDRT